MWLNLWLADGTGLGGEGPRRCDFADMGRVEVGVAPSASRDHETGRRTLRRIETGDCHVRTFAEMRYRLASLRK